MRALSGAETDFSWDYEVMAKSWGDIDIFNLASKFNILKGHTFVAYDNLGNIAMFTIIKKAGSLADFGVLIESYRDLFTRLLYRCHSMNLRLRGINNEFPYDTREHCRNKPERSQIYRCGGDVIEMPLKNDEIIVSETLLDQLLERAGYKVSRLIDSIIS